LKRSIIKTIFDWVDLWFLFEFFVIVEVWSFWNINFFFLWLSEWNIKLLETSWNFIEVEDLLEFLSSNIDS
jgi:hypothetical protein